MACGSYEFASQFKSQASASLFFFTPSDTGDAILKFLLSNATYAKSRK